MVKSSGQLTVVLVDWDDINPKFSTRKKINVDIISTGSLRFMIMTFIIRLTFEAHVMV